jgi:hypothetical protein
MSKQSASASDCLQDKLPACVVPICQLLDLNYYDTFEAICTFLQKMTQAHPALVAKEVPALMRALLVAYNTLPVEEDARLVKAVESALDLMANDLDAHTMMQVQPDLDCVGLKADCV